MSGIQYNTSCIYRIVCFTSFRCYIGQSRNPDKREYEHFRLLKLNQHYNCHLQRAFNLYGSDAFYFETLERGIPIDDIDNREKYWITYFDSHHNGFNQAPGGDLSYRGKPCVWNGIQYPSITTAALDIGIEPSSLRERLVRGYICDADVYEPGEQGNKPCIWNGVDYPSQKAAAKALGISKEGMKWRIQHGYKCDDDMPQRRACIWNGITYRSIMDCSRAIGIPHVTLIRWLNRGIVCDNDRPNYRKVK